MKFQTPVILIAMLVLATVVGHSEQKPEKKLNQKPDQKSEQPVPSPEKKKLIKELLDLTDAKENGTKITDSALQMVGQQFRYMMMQSLAQGEKPDAAKQKEIAGKIAEGYNRFIKKYQERLSKEVNGTAAAEEAASSLFDQSFTESELKDLVAFYKTPIGKKAFRVMPQLMTESMQRTSQALYPKLAKLCAEIMEEEKKQLMGEGKPIESTSTNSLPQKLEKK